MAPGGVMIATCLASALGTLLMGLLANYPIALAPAMGHNIFFAFVAVGLYGFTWQQALAATFISGAIFIATSFWGLRERIVNFVPESLKGGIAAGIGLLIALLGLEWAGVVVAQDVTLMKLGDVRSVPVLLSLGGLALMAVLLAWRVRGAIVIGIVATAAAGWALGVMTVETAGGGADAGEAGRVWLALDFAGLFSRSAGARATFGGAIEAAATVIFVFFFLDLFDTVGTLIGVSKRAGFMKDGKLPRARQALLADAIATSAGALMGTSTVTSYIESNAGVAEGGRTGLANMVTALCFVLVLVAWPLAPYIEMLGQDVRPNLAAASGPSGRAAGATAADPAAVEAERERAQNPPIRPAIAPALILVGCFIMLALRDVDWVDMTEALPAFLTITVMAFTFSITEGIAFGFISYSVLKLLTLRWRDSHWLVHALSAVLVARYVFLRT